MQAPDRRPVEIPPSQPVQALALPPGTERWGTDLTKLARQEKSIQEAASKTPDIVRSALSPKVLSFAAVPFIPSPSRPI